MDMEIKRTDGNQKEIMQALRKAGFSVVDLHVLGKGCPDILVGTHHANVLVEIKMPGCKLNDLEKEFYNSWQGPVCVVSSAEEAVKSVMAWAHIVY